MSILINKDTKVITQGITGKTGQFHTRMCRDYANGKAAFVAGVNPKKAGEDFEGIPIFATVKDAAKNTGATVSVIYVPPAGAAAAIWEAVEADLDLAICITEGIPVRDMLEVRNRMLAKEAADTVRQGVCSAQAVDMAMQQGVNYPRGPLAWADTIGIGQIVTVLTNLAASYGEDRYRVSPLLRRKYASGAGFHA